MAKVSPNSIQNLQEDWGHDQNTNLPFSGESVQAFIKSFLKNVTTAAWFDTATATMYFFASSEDRDSFINDQSQATLPVFSCPMNFSGELYRVNITNNNGSTALNVATNSGTLPLSVSYVVQKKAITETSWTDTVTRCYVTVYIDRGLTGNYAAITERTLYNSGATIALDIFGYLANGANHVKFQFEAEDGTVTSALTYTITLAELYVELFNNTWYQPILGRDVSTHQLGGFRIAGAGSKTLHISLFDSTGAKVVDDLTTLIGTTNAYASTPYYYRFAQGSPILDLATGVYKVQVSVTTGTLESEAIEYNTMFVAAGDEATARLVCLNSVAEKAFNYSTATLCTYAVYNGGASFADLTATFRRMDGNMVVGTTEQAMEDMTTGEVHTLGYEVLWPGIEGTGYFIAFSLALGLAEASDIVVVDNSTVFPPTSGYDFYMLASNRSNGEAAKEEIVNLADNAQLQANWTDVDFQNGMDGWTLDDEGRACLRIPAGSRMVLPASAFNFFTGDNCTLELCYKVVNVADYDEDVITFGTGHGTAGFSGIRIKPTNVTVHSAADTTAGNDIYQSTNLCDEETVHFALTVNPFYEGTHKLVKGYVNGGKNFLFAYNSSVDWQIGGSLTIGSDKSDVFLYFVRHYPVALSDAAVQVNYINSLTSVQERGDMDERLASVLDAGQTNIDFEAVKNSGFNFFVVTMEQGNGVPSASNSWGKKTTGVSTLEMHFGAHPEWDWKMEHLETMGQGTTSMNYYRWNIRWRIDKSNDSKKVPVAYLASRTKSGGKYFYEWEEASSSKTVRFDGGQHPAVMRITAKINMASSMQSHKIGATRAYSELHDAIGLRNEAQVAADSNETPRPVVAVYQYPAFGFEYDARTDTYTFIGLFTIGPDKGDKPTFGFDTVKNTLISMEGTDHNQPLAKFAYPWNSDVDYYYDQEGLAVDLGSGNRLTGLEIGNCHGLEIDKENKEGKAARDQDALRGVMEDEFKPAYELVRKNSTLIFPILSGSEWHQGTVADTLDYINAHLSDVPAIGFQGFRNRMFNDRLSYADLQFWIEGDNTYTLHFFDEKDGVYKADMSLLEQNGAPAAGTTAQERNEWFKAQRRERFMAGAGDYWDLDDAIYHFVFLLMLGATDNFAKNSYPYIMATLALGGRWKWRQDDLDSIFDIDNSGRDSKPYQIEYADAVGNTPYFAGSNSVFWTLINECYWDDYNNGAGRGIRSIGQAVIAAMVSLSGANNPFDGFVKYVERCFWNNAQNYFPSSAYNVDGTFKYEQAWLVNGQNVPPLTQALGDHFSGERLWVRRRAVYILSLFRAGPFGDYSDTSLGTISFRPNSLQLSLTPLMWLYPALAVGQNAVVHGGRTAPGAVAVLAQTADGNTAMYIQGTNHLTSLGNLKNVVLGLQDINNITITGAKLTEFLIGSATPGEVTTNIPGLVFANTRCLELIDARNAASITAVQGLANCIRLRTLLLEGTSVTAIDVPMGSKLETLTLPATIQRIALRSLKRLTSLDVDGCSAVNTLIVEGCPGIDPFDLLADVLQNSSVLQYVRLLWNGVYEDVAGDTIDALLELATGDYRGLAADGNTVTEKPFIEGTIDITGCVESPVIPVWLDIESDEAYGENYRRMHISNFGTQLSIIYDPNNIRIAGYLRTVEGEYLRDINGLYLTARNN